MSGHEWACPVEVLVWIWLWFVPLSVGDWGGGGVVCGSECEWACPAEVLVWIWLWFVPVSPRLAGFPFQHPAPEQQQ